MKITRVDYEICYVHEYVDKYHSIIKRKFLSIFTKIYMLHRDINVDLLIYKLINCTHTHTHIGYIKTYNIHIVQCTIYNIDYLTFTKSSEL